MLTFNWRMAVIEVDVIEGFYYMTPDRFLFKMGNMCRPYEQSIDLSPFTLLHLFFHFVTLVDCQKCIPVQSNKPVNVCVDKVDLSK